MKKKIIGLLLILAIMAAVPLILSNKKIIMPLKANNSQTSEKEENIITKAAAYNFRKHYNSETLKAIVLILNSNNKVNRLSKNELLTKSEFIKKYKDGESYYSNIEKTVSKLKDEFITYKNKAVYVPCFKVSKGNTETNKKFPYLKAAACPWDKIKKECKTSNNTVGVSINTLDKLCAQGLSYKEAVRYFVN